MVGNQVNEVAFEYRVDENQVEQVGRYKAYPEYKDSGVEWVGEIPSTWTVKPVFSVFDPTTVKNSDGKEWNVLSLSYGNIIRRDVEKNFGLLPESFNTYQIVNTGDIILRLTDLQNDKRSLRVGLAKEKGIITSAYLKLFTKQGLNSKFAYRLLHSYDTTKVFYGLGGGLRQSMKFEDFRRLPILVPPLNEQENIAGFLDHETAKIDTLIEKQQRLIELLTEKRQAVISHAVTKGLNPDVPMKDSGVEWLGQVPKHWDYLKFDYVVNSVGDIDHYMPKSVDSGIPYLMTGDLKDLVSEIDFNQCKQVNYSSYLQLSRKTKTRKGDIILARYATIGTVSYVDIDAEFLVSYSCVTINPNTNIILGRYLYWYLKSQAFVNAIQEYINSNTQGNVGVDSLKKVKLVVPPLLEQENIVTFIEEITSKFDSLIFKAQQAIQLMQERRTALISAAVTGKIDVSDWVNPKS